MCHKNTFVQDKFVLQQSSNRLIRLRLLNGLRNLGQPGPSERNQTKWQQISYRRRRNLKMKKWIK